MQTSKMNVCKSILGLVLVCVVMAGCTRPAETPKPAEAPKAVEAPEAERLGPYELVSTDMGEGFITNWLIVGTFPNPGERPDNEGFNIDYLKEYGGEPNHIPANGMEIAGPNDTKVKWAPYKSEEARIDFFSVEHLGLSYEQEDILTYSACWLECEKDMEVEIRVGSDDGYKLWIDNKLIGEEHVYRAVELDQETYPLKLSKGMHLILIKVDQDWGEFEFMMRVVTPDGQAASGIKVWN